MTAEELPRARVRRRRIFRLIWVVPIVALAVAAWLIYQHARSIGPEIAVTFSDGAGLRSGQTPLKYRGVAIGEVSRVELSDDQKQVIVRIRLVRSAAPIAREGATFWIVRPQVGWGNVTGLGTVISGPEIQAQAGRAGATHQSNFRGLERAPSPAGLRLVLKGERPVSLRPGSPVYFRGVEVGAVHDVRLSADATAAEVQIIVLQRYAALVRTGSAFWNVSGLTVSGGIMKGIQLELESIRSLVAGGIEFASPEKSPPAKPGTAFFLHDAPRKEWLGWNARISIAKE